MAAKEGARVIATDVNAEVLKQLDGTPGKFSFLFVKLSTLREYCVSTNNACSNISVCVRLLLKNC